jgi:hypothetical protein
MRLALVLLAALLALPMTAEAMGPVSGHHSVQGRHKRHRHKKHHRKHGRKKHRKHRHRHHRSPEL